MVVLFSFKPYLSEWCVFVKIRKSHTTRSHRERGEGWSSPTTTPPRGGCRSATPHHPQPTPEKQSPRTSWTAGARRERLEVQGVKVGRSAPTVAFIAVGVWAPGLELVSSLLSLVLNGRLWRT